VMAELVQAWGRARPVHRTAPVVVVHLGAVAPDLDVAPQWRGAVAAPSAKGRPRRADAAGAALDASTWEADRQVLQISKRAHAARLGLAVQTYLDAVVRHAASKDTPPSERKVPSDQRAPEQAQAGKPLVRTFRSPGGDTPGALNPGADLTFGVVPFLGGTPPVDVGELVQLHRGRRLGGDQATGTAGPGGPGG